MYNVLRRLWNANPIRLDDHVSNQVRVGVYNQVSDQIGDRFLYQVKDHIRDQVLEQR